MNEENRSDEVSVIELLIAAWRYKWLMLACPLVAAVVAAIWSSSVLSPAWEASATLEIGRIWQQNGVAGSVALFGASPVEGASTTVLRMKDPNFSTSRLNVTQVKNTELVDVRVRAPSAESARKLILESIAKLQKVHGEMMDATIGRYAKQLQILNENIQNTKAEIEVLRKKLLANHNWNAFDATLSANVLQDKSMELRQMTEERLTLEEQLSPSRTYNTRVLGEVSVSSGPVSPNKSLIVGVAMLLGLAGAVLAAFVHSLIAKRSQRAI